MDSKLQIISGRFRGRKLALPPNARPTQNRARVALFNMLDGIIDTPPSVVWDAFAGSGAFGIEILSRYQSARAIFTDTAPTSINTIRKNVAQLAPMNAQILQSDAIEKIRDFGPIADIIFIDPPYADGKLGALFIKKLVRVIHPGAIVIWEQDAAAAIAPGDAWRVLRDRKYGRARFLILDRCDEPIKNP